MGDRRHPNLRPDPIHMTVGNDAGLQWRSGMLGITSGFTVSCNQVADA